MQTSLPALPHPTTQSSVHIVSQQLITHSQEMHVDSVRLEDLIWLVWKVDLTAL